MNCHRRQLHEQSNNSSGMKMNNLLMEYHGTKALLKCEEHCQKDKTTAYRMRKDLLQSCIQQRADIQNISRKLDTNEPNNPVKIKWCHTETSQ